MAAACDLIDNNPVACFEFGGVFSYFFYPSNHLMANNSGIGGGCIGTMVDTYVGTTDAGGGHPNQYIVHVIHGWFFHINDFQLIWLRNLYSFHTK